MPATVTNTRPEQRILEAAVVLPEVGGVTGWAALRWCGAVWLDGYLADGHAIRDVELATCYQDIRSQPGFLVRQESLGPHELVMVGGIRVTHLTRSLCFAMRYARNVLEATVVADMTAYSDLVSIAEAAAYVGRSSGLTGIGQARDALALAEENSWSPQEVMMRLIWRRDAGLPPPLCNRPIFDLQGNHLGTPDLFEPETGTYGEYDGAVHLLGAQRTKDLRRDDVLREHGLEPFVVMAGDMSDRALVVGRMHGTRDRAKRVPPSRRTWTLTPPPWWIPTWTVEQRRALGERERARLLRYRRGA